MTIPESQLQTWSHQGAVTTAKATHESIRSALDSYEFPEGVSYEVYLQGSYKNDTNIRGDSDVDVAVQLNSSFQRDLSSLSEAERQLYEQNHSDATYRWENFRGDVLRVLRGQYGAQAVREGNKSIKIAGASGRLPADVIVCIQYRKYRRYQSTADQDYVEGIAFYTQRENRHIINFPKCHYDNGVEKNSPSNSNGEFKPTVRLFKNARTYLINQNVINQGLAPSYFLECLIHNVPNNAFGGNYQQKFCNVVNFLAQANLTTFTCQNKQLPLFGASAEQWAVADAQNLVNALVSLWNNW